MHRCENLGCQIRHDARRVTTLQSLECLGASALNPSSSFCVHRLAPDEVANRVVYLLYFSSCGEEISSSRQRTAALGGDCQHALGATGRQGPLVRGDLGYHLYVKSDSFVEVRSWRSHTLSPLNLRHQQSTDVTSHAI